MIVMGYHMEFPRNPSDGPIVKNGSNWQTANANKNARKPLQNGLFVLLSLLAWIPIGIFSPTG